MELHLHIVSFNIPYPPNYGGIIDVYYKIKALYSLGVKIYLHNFDYGRGEQFELENICHKVFYYKRDTKITKAITKTPYIIKSRSNVDLLNNLLLDDYPILFEGLHTTYFLNNKQLKDRFKIVRVHNIEHDYYNFLSKQESNVFKKIYFNKASNKLKMYESVLNKADYIAAISLKDFEYFSKKYNNTFLLPPFHSNNNIDILKGFGKYIFYHGNLSVVENVKSVLFLIDIYKNTDIRFIIAGKNPTKELLNKVINVKNIEIVENPTEEEMNKLISEAHVHLLPTFQPTGIKLKLIESLYKGRYCVVNKAMVNGTGLSDLCYLANSRNDFIDITNKLMQKEFSIKDIRKRQQILGEYFNNKKNAEYLISILNKNIK